MKKMQIKLILKHQGAKMPLAIAIILLLSILISAMTPTANAAQIETNIYVVAAPNPIGVNQVSYVTFIIPNVPPAQFPYANPRSGNWTGITITITKPDGTTDIISKLETGEAGAGTVPYTPTQVGTYQIQASFSGQTIETGTSKGNYYKPSTSTKSSLTVQNKAVETIPDYPLPTSYWTFPIEGENRQWNILSGNWLAGDNVNASTNGYNPYSEAPATAHVLWSQRRMPGGLVGGSYGADIYNYGRWPGSGNGLYWGPPIVINGILYANEPQPNGNPEGFSAFNLATGEKMWAVENDSISFGTVYQFQTRMMNNVYSYLWGTSGSTWRVYEAYTGHLLQTIANVTSGTTAFGPSGELLVYSLSGTSLRMWNSTLYFYSTMLKTSYGPKYVPNNIWAPDPGTFDFKGGWQWNVTVPSGLGSINKIVPNDVLILSRSFAATNTTNPIAQQTAIDISYDTYLGTGSGQQARILWGPINRTLWIDASSYERIEAVGDGIFVMYKRELLKILAFDLHTGNQLWSSEPFDNAFTLFNGESNNFIIAEGKVFTGGYDGVMRAYDAKTGKLAWQTSVGPSNYETAYGSYPIGGSYDYFKAANGVLFAGTNEHSPSIIPYKNAKIWAFNMTDGKIIWNLTSTLAEVQIPVAVAGMYIYMNGYDGKIYSIAKGPSETTVTATPGTAGTAITIQGTVIDQSPGAKQLIEESKFNVIPAVSDASQSEWMAYLYMQKPKPTNVIGVSVHLTAIDPNGNFQDIGYATSNSLGNYAISWKPPVPGMYTITATFAGSGAYYGSEAGTSFFASEAQAKTTAPVASSNPTPSTLPTLTPMQSTSPSPSTVVEPPTSQAPTTTYIAISVAVVIVVIATAALVLRRRKQI